MARHFPKTAELWELAEAQIECSGQSSKCASVFFIFLIILMAILQTAFGTMGTALIAIRNPEKNDTNTGVTNAFQKFLEQYR